MAEPEKKTEEHPHHAHHHSHHDQHHVRVSHSPTVLITGANRCGLECGEGRENPKPTRAYHPIHALDRRFADADPPRSGIGLATAVAFAAAGWNTYASVRDLSKADALVEVRCPSSSHPRPSWLPRGLAPAPPRPPSPPPCRAASTC